MLGYVRASVPELRMREYDCYRSLYCGLCRHMGKCTGQCSRLALSYDMVFLALARIGISNESVGFKRAVCIAHPFQKRSYMESNPTLEYCSSAAAILNYHKIKDDLSDEKGMKKLRAALLMPIAAYGRNKALRQGFADLDARISDGLSRLALVEGERTPSVDTPAAVFGEILGEILSFGEEGHNARILRTLGTSVGRWIYIADALEDWEEDAKKGRYNPFILLYGKEKPETSELESIRIAMKNELVAAESAFDLMDVENDDTRRILENILFLGLPSRANDIGAGNKKNSRKENR